MRIAQEEIFGPVLTTLTFRDPDEAVRIANDTIYGLAAYFFSENASRLTRVAEALEYGIVGANNGLPSTAQAPFGGYKRSGLGREGGKYVMDEYTETKYISLGVNP
jgi:succinate-semialdehyde dehydrogenase/glutarate-semialdehyde dehydrogenase